MYVHVYACFCNRCLCVYTSYMHVLECMQLLVYVCVCVHVVLGAHGLCIFD